MLSWVRFGTHLLMFSLCGSAAPNRGVLPVGAFMNPQTTETRPVPWTYSEFSSDAPRDAVVVRQKPSYTEYLKGNEQITGVKGAYYQTGGQFDCRAHAIAGDSDTFSETCADLFDTTYKIIDFSHRRTFGTHGYFILRAGGVFFLSAGYWRDGVAETYPFQYPWITVVNTVKGEMTTYKFGKPDQKAADEAARCSDGHGGRLMKPVLIPSGDVVDHHLIVLALPYLRAGEGLNYTENCRLRFVFNMKTNKGRYLLITKTER